MAKLTLYLDQRKADKNGNFPIKFHISNRTTTTTISTGIATISKYFRGDPMQAVLRSAPCAGQTNAAVYELYCRYLDAILELERENRINGMTAAEIRKFAEGNKTDRNSFSYQITYVPLIVYSSAINENTHISEELYQADIYPTILPLIGLKDYYWRAVG